MRWAGHVACLGERRAYTEFWWGHLRERDHFGYPWHRWEDNIKMELEGVGCGDMERIELAQGRDRWRERVNVVINLRVP
jgi:hypothetical protein